MTRAERFDLGVVLAAIVVPVAVPLVAWWLT